MSFLLEAGDMAFPLLLESKHFYDTRLRGIMLPVELAYGDRRVLFDAGLDTGASFCVFEREFGEQLGLSIEAGDLQVFGTATGTFRAFGHELTLKVFAHEFYVRVYFAEHHSFQRNVLGRQGFLDRVLLGLDDHSGTLYLSRNS